MSEGGNAGATQGYLLRCERCSGRMFLERYTQPCDTCKRTGASSCPMCWVHEELSCVNCGGVVYLPRKRKGELG